MPNGGANQGQHCYLLKYHILWHVERNIGVAFCYFPENKQFYFLLPSCFKYYFAPSARSQIHIMGLSYHGPHTPTYTNTRYMYLHDIILCFCVNHSILNPSKELFLTFKNRTLFSWRILWLIINYHQTALSSFTTIFQRNSPKIQPFLLYLHTQWQTIWLPAI